eukprot:gene3120-6138_t
MNSDETESNKMKPSNLVEYCRGKSVLGFGDSLTYGLVRSDFGLSEDAHPYSIRLSNLLNNQTSHQTSVFASGIPGEITSQMIARLPKKLRDYTNIGLVIILGGTNDIGHRIDVSDIVSNIKFLHTTSLHVNSENPQPVYTIAVTIPQSGWAVANNIQERYKINEQIRKFVQSCPQRIALLDIENSFDQRVPENLKYWSDDRLHLSALGYDALGELLFETMLKPQRDQGKYLSNQKGTTIRSSQSFWFRTNMNNSTYMKSQCADALQHDNPLSILHQILH